jgi:hypothetical protein
LEHGEIVVSTFGARDNHPLTPFRFAHNMLRTEVKNLIIETHETGIQLATIFQVLKERGTFFTPTQICTIFKRKRIRKFRGEWREL